MFFWSGLQRLFAHTWVRDGENISWKNLQNIKAFSNGTKKPKNKLPFTPQRWDLLCDYTVPPLCCHYNFIICCYCYWCCFCYWRLSRPWDDEINDFLPSPHNNQFVCQFNSLFINFMRMANNWEELFLCMVVRFRFEAVIFPVFHWIFHFIHSISCNYREKCGD